MTVLMDVTENECTAAMDLGMKMGRTDFFQTDDGRGAPSITDEVGQISD